MPILIAIPAYFAIQVVKASDSPTETKEYWTLTEFGKTRVQIICVHSLIDRICFASDISHGHEYHSSGQIQKSHEKEGRNRK